MTSLSVPSQVPKGWQNCEKPFSAPCWWYFDDLALPAVTVV